MQFDHNKKMGIHRMYGMLDAEVEVSRTTKRAPLTAFYFCKKKSVPARLFVGLWRGEMESLANSKVRLTVGFGLGGGA